MKTVFNSSEVAHVWARQSQDHGRSNASVYFEGAKIYSYGSHFCMGNIIKDGIVLITNRSYSVTTSKHLGWVRYAVNHMEQIYVPHPEGKLIDQLPAWKNRIEANLEIIMLMFTDKETAHAIYQDFKWKYIAQAGDKLVITKAEILKFIEEHKPVAAN